MTGVSSVDGMGDEASFSGSSPQPPDGMGEAVACLQRAARILREVVQADIPAGASHALGKDLIAVLGALDDVKLACADGAAVFQARGGLKGSGQPSLARWLQHTADRAPAEASQLASLAHRSAHLEESEQAHADGEISLARFERICHWVGEGLHVRCRKEWPKAEAFVHAAEGTLLALACEPSATVRKLNHAGRRVRYMCDPARHEREYQDRYVGRGARLTRGVDDSFHLEAWGDEASGDVLRNALDAFLTPPRDSDERTSAQRTHDALIEICHTVAELSADKAPCRKAGAAPVTVVVGLDLLQGEREAGPAVSEYGTLWPASAARAHAGDCVLTRLVVDPLDGRVVDVGRSQRLFPPAVRVALKARYRTCAWEGGCDRPVAWCQADHRQAWWDGGASDLANAQPLCRFHNLEKEHRRARERGWAHRPHKKKRPLSPPTQPSAGRPPGVPEQRKRSGRGARLPDEDSDASDPPSGSSTDPSADPTS
ncbi:hypothetical protein GCM10009800_03650 [Nocardiopsis rhodophaea]